MPMRFCRSTSQFRRLTQMMGWFANPQSEHDSYHFIFGTMVCLLLESKCKGLAVVITDWNTRRSKVGMDHVRIHPKFLHSNATSHKWALGDGNGFKTSTMRLGADVIVFTRCCGKDGKSATHSIGLLSYTFLRSTGKEDAVVPMIHWKQASRMVLSLYSKKKLCYSASIHLLRNHILSLPKHRDSSSKKPKKKLEFPRHKLAYSYFGAAILYPPELVHR